MRQGLVRIAVVLLTGVVLTAASAQAPTLMRRIDAFAVQRVEVTGVRHMSPEMVVEAAGITVASSIFDDPTQWRDAVLRHPLVRDVSIERSVPGTLRIAIDETRPVGFARTPELHAIDEQGRLLPADPAAEGMDLPVLLVETRVTGDGHAADEETLRIAAFLGMVRQFEPGLLGWVSEIGVHDSEIRLVLRSNTDADVLVPARPTAERLRELHYTLSDLAAPRFAAASAGDEAADSVARTAAPELARVRRIDGRFHDQIVVALHRGKN
ncbi:MAG TPA: FtsQ-type POTRA domain-containing protein [Longimicrobiales bacterium]|nr:FtsQ-type POTRA domain-containing protein [Longimicrobiales bacterium]